MLALQGCTGLHRAAQGCTGLQKAAQGCTGLNVDVEGPRHLLALQGCRKPGISGPGPKTRGSEGGKKKFQEFLWIGCYLPPVAPRGPAAPFPPIPPCASREMKFRRSTPQNTRKVAKFRSKHKEGAQGCTGLHRAVQGSLLMLPVPATCWLYKAAQGCTRLRRAAENPRFRARGRKRGISREGKRNFKNFYG